MSSVGPQLPPHLQKRKRSTDDEEPPNSPPRKLQAAASPRVLGPSLPPTANPDEVDIESSDDDDYGPSAQPSKTRQVLGPSAPPKKSSPPRNIGPSMPPNNPDELEIDSEEDDYGPSVIPAPSKPPSPPRKRILGPAPPPAPLSELPPHHPSDSDSGSESDYGPSLPPAPGSAAHSALESRRAQEAASLAASASEPSKPQRPEWMLAPPTSSDWTSRVDPTKLKARKFASGKGAKAPAEKTGVSAIWTETPEEKRRRLEDAVLGRHDSSAGNNGDGGRDPRMKAESKKDAETDRRIREYNEKNRGKSLYAEHAERKGEAVKKEEDDPSKRGFDREKDMALGGRLGNAQKKELLNKAADFGSRFQKGKYL
ncbi:hypothetical protein ACMFMF_004244 [Clarireedia jacksonii]